MFLFQENKWIIENLQLQGEKCLQGGISEHMRFLACLGELHHNQRMFWDREKRTYIFMFQFWMKTHENPKFKCVFLFYVQNTPQRVIHHCNIFLSILVVWLHDYGKMIRHTFCCALVCKFLHYARYSRRCWLNLIVWLLTPFTLIITFDNCMLTFLNVIWSLQLYIHKKYSKLQMMEVRITSKMIRFTIILLSFAESLRFLNVYYDCKVKKSS